MVPPGSESKTIIGPKVMALRKFKGTAIDTSYIEREYEKLH